MKPLLYLPALLLAAACAGHHRPPSSPAALPAWDALPATGDSLVVLRAQQSRVARLLGLPARPSGGSVGLPIGKVGKHSTVNVYYGPATVSTTTAGKKSAAGPGATTTTKPAAPVAAGAGATATDYRKQGQRGGAAASGAGARATATTSKGLSWWWLLLLAVAGVGYAAWRVCKRNGFFVV